MTLPIDQWYEIIFLSQHPMGPQLGEKAVAKVASGKTSDLVKRQFDED